LRKLDSELTILRPEETVSPYQISRKSNIPLPIVQNLLMELSYDSSLAVTFIVFCNNSDHDFNHAFDFDSRKELREFITHTGHICPDCGSRLNMDDIRIAYKKGHYLGDYND
jgi:hypothetical protein